MSYLRLTAVALFLMGPAVAHAADGAVYVYLQPLPPGMERVTFTVGSAGAAAEGGGETALKIVLANVRGRDERRQRLLATGRVEAGSYTGLTITVEKASVRRDGGDAALLAPDAPIRVSAPFLVARGGAVVLWLSIDATAPASGEVTFSPAVSAHLADRPIPGRTGFVSNSRSDTVTVFDKRLRQAAVVVPTAAGPAGMALDQRRGRLYVACSRDDEIQVIDVAEGEIIERARLAAGDGPREIALTPDGRTLVSANSDSNTVSVFDADPLTLLERVSVGNAPGSLVIDPTGRRAFVFNTLSNTISVVDIAARTVTATLSVEAPPLRGEFSARGDRLYVVHERSPYLTVVDPLQLTIVARARLRSGIGAIKADPRRNLIFIGGPDDPMLEFYDPNTLLPLGAMKTGTGISHLTIDGEENSLYAVSAESRTLVVCSLADRKRATEIDVGDGPFWVAVMGER